MLNQVKIIVFAALSLISISFNCLAFDVLDLSEYSHIATKSIMASDTIKPDSKGKVFKIRGTSLLEKVFEKQDHDYNATFIYVGNDTFELNDSAQWRYYYHDSWKDRQNPGRGQLKYKRNKVMESLKTGDLLLIGKKGDDDIDIIVIQQDNKAIGEVYEFMATKLGVPGAEKSKQRKKSKNSFWSFNWLSSRRDTKKSTPVADAGVPNADIFETQAKEFEPETDDVVEQMPIDTKWKSLNVDFYFDTNTQKTIVVGVVSHLDDGDSFWMTPLLHFRHVGYDAPEEDQFCKNSKGRDYNCGAASTAYMKKLIGGRPITCTYIARDAYSRLLTSCVNYRGDDIAFSMIEQGHGIALNKKKYRPAEDAAKSNHRGIWQGEFITPKSHRENQKSQCEDDPTQSFCVKYGYKKPKK